MRWLGQRQVHNDDRHDGFDDRRLRRRRGRREARPGRGQERGHAHRRRRRDLRAERVHRHRRQDGRGHGRRSRRGDRQAHGPQGQVRQRDLRLRSSRASRPASTTSACRRSPTPRSARRPSTSSPTSRPARRSTSKARAARRSTTLADLCGHTVAVEKGTTQQDDATAQSKKCKRRASRRDRASSPTRTAPTWRSSSGRADVGMADSPPAAYAGQAVGRQVQAVRRRPTAPRRTGSRSPRTTAWPKPVLAALKALMANGTYDAILDEVGRLETGAITNPTINGAIELGQRRSPDVAGTATAQTDETTARPERDPGRSGPPLRAAGSRRRSSLLIAARLIHSVATNPRFEWDVVGDFLFDHRILARRRRDARADRRSSMVIGIVLGVVLAVMRLSPEPARVAARAGSTSGSSAARRCSSRSCSGTTSPRSTRRSPRHPVRRPPFIHVDANDADHAVRRRRCWRSG